MSQTLRLAQPLLEENQLMLINYMAQQSCFTAKELLCPASVNPQQLCLSEAWVPAAAQVLCSAPPDGPIQGRAKGRVQRKRQKWKENLTWAERPNWSPFQRLNWAFLTIVALVRLTGFCKYRPTAVPLQRNLTATVFHAGWKNPQPRPRYSYLTGGKRHLMKGSQLLDEASAHLCLSGSQRSSRYFPAGKTRHWSSHFQNYSGNPTADGVFTKI